MKKILKNAIFYEIYPQSFLDTNGDGIGDFNGIIQKLDYIKDLGFTAIWMNPCFDSPFTDAGYDVRDYYKVAPRYGTNDDLKNLFSEAHKRGLSVILDLVPGHTSYDCEWFKKSMLAEKNEYTDRYVWTDCITTLFQNVSGINGCLRGISDRDGCCAVNFFSTQPALNYGFANPSESWQCAVDSEAALSTRAEMLNVMRFWLSLGCDGFRVDMASSLVKNDYDHAATIRLWQEVFAVIRKEFPEAVFVSEWGEPKKSLLAGFDMDFLLHFGPSHYSEMFHMKDPFFSPNGQGKAKEFFINYLDCYRQTKEYHGLMSLPSGNHDMERLSYFCDETQMKLVYAFMFSMPGIPFVYYGDEIGMRYVPNLTSVEGGFFRTGARTPMQWNNEKNAGFSTASPEKLYVTQDADMNRPTVEKQLKDSNSILSEVKRLIAIRRANEVLQETADFELISDDIPLLYTRTLGEEKVLVAINPSETERVVPVKGIKQAEVIYAVGQQANVESEILTLPAFSATYLSVK
ncbi:MAG: glycosylase [Clostridiales bacterium]|nr:glycosylase [Clostridiales bacterium]